MQNYSTSIKTINKNIIPINIYFPPTKEINVIEWSMKINSLITNNSMEQEILNNIFIDMLYKHNLIDKQNKNLFNGNYEGLSLITFNTIYQEI